MSDRAAIYYFSGTGNSLAVARDIAEKLNGELVSIPSVMDREHIATDATVIGVVFPVYFATNDTGVPLIVERFVGKLDGIGPKYVFAVCTHSGMPGTTIGHFCRIIEARGGKLAAGFAVRMVAPPTAIEKLKQAIHGGRLPDSNETKAGERQQETLYDARKKLETIIEYVSARKTGVYETSSALHKLIWAPLRSVLIRPMFTRRYERLADRTDRPFSELIQGADRSFRSGKQCSGCGTCARVCPTGNIEMADGKPSWQHHCENCIACYVWCPKAAISGGIVAYNERLHHPGVRLSDMLKGNARPPIKTTGTARRKSQNCQEVLQ